MIINISKQAIDARENDLECIYNVINDYNQQLNDYMEALFSSGLDEKDIKPLEIIMKHLKKLEFTLKKYISEDVQVRRSYLPVKAHDSVRNLNNETAQGWAEEKKEAFYSWDSLISYEKELLKALGQTTISFYQILRELKNHYKAPSFYDFIQQEASLLHLVSTNNHAHANIKKVSDDAFLFCCHFHSESNPSMRVNAHNNTLRCYGCGTTLNIASYIMNIEGIDYYHAMALLAAIYKIEFRNNPYNEESPLVKKYTNYYALAKYQKRLETGYRRAQYKNKNFNNFLAIENYQRELALLERLKKGEYISYEKKGDNKRLVYEMPNFSKTIE